MMLALPFYYSPYSKAAKVSGFTVEVQFPLNIESKRLRYYSVKSSNQHFTAIEILSVWVKQSMDSVHQTKGLASTRTGLNPNYTLGRFD